MALATKSFNTASFDERVVDPSVPVPLVGIIESFSNMILNISDAGGVS